MAGRKRLNRVLGGAVLLWGLWPLDALAVQAHEGYENLITHQLGHLLLAAGLVFLLVQMRRLPTAATHPGWRAFFFFLVTLLFWDLLTFVGHWLDLTREEGQFLRDGDRILAFRPRSTTDFLFYFSKLDHLLLVPALVFLYLALRHWRHSGEEVP